jgi:hypothetical protein
MTSQVVLFNGNGVAIASDSAVTTGSRVLDTAEKIFPIPEPHQMAVIVSGWVNIHGFPIGVLLGEWFSTLGESRLPSARSYSESFVRFLNSSNLFSPESSLRYLQVVFDELFNDVSQIDLEHSNTDGNEDIEAKARTYRDSLLSYSPLDGFDEEYGNDLFDRYITLENVESWRECWLPHPTDVEVHVFKQLLSRYVKRSLIGSWTGIAFVGFGANEIMPSFFKRDIRAVLAGRTLGRLWDERTFSPAEGENYVGYFPLAQSDAIDAFVRGYRAEFVTAATDAVARRLTGVRDVEDDISTELLEIVSATSVEALQQGINQSDQLERFMRNIATIPIRSLVSVAQSLIQVQALSAMLSYDLQTVGGPVDAAVITRREGFVWHRQSSLAGNR